jgi:hypothetical protein
LNQYLLVCGKLGGLWSAARRIADAPFFVSGNPQVEDETERELSPKPWRRVLDAPAQIRLFVKLKLAICARPEHRAGFLMP